jgi:hypothetical protein
VTETVPAGFVASTATTFTTDLWSGQELVAFAGQSGAVPPQEEVLIGADLMFGNLVLGSIHGYKFEDQNFNGVDDGEPRLEGVLVTLTGVDGLGNIIAPPLTATTDVNGEYGFTDLWPGNYTVTETPPIGSTPITPDFFDEVLLSRQELVAYPGQANLPPGALQEEVVVAPDLIFGNYFCEITCEAYADPEEGVNPLTVTFTANGTVPDPPCPWDPTWEWDFGNGNTSTEQNPIYTYTEPGDYTWTMTVTNLGITCAATGEIHVYAYDHTFYDDYGRSWACVNSLNGDWDWTALDPRVGVFNTGRQPGIVQGQSGILVFRSIAGMPWSMVLKYNMLYKRANGYYRYLAI